MIIVEALLITCLAAALGFSSYSDLKDSIIPNRLLVRCAIPAVICDIIYYPAWAAEYLPLFFVNLAVLTVVGIIFYAYNLWAAGDCKLLMVVGLCIPGRFYTFMGNGFGVSFYIVAIVFSIAFLYVVAESIVLSIKNHELFKITFGGFGLKEALISYFSMVGALTVVSILLSQLFPALSEQSEAISVAINFLIVLTLIQIRQHVSKKVIVIAMIVSWVIVAVFSYIGIYGVKFSFNIWSWVLVLVVMALRLASDKYNYRTIPTSEVKAGQILSAATVMGMAASRVHGLPTSSTEDLRSRLTAEEADSVHRWEASAHGKPYVVIVRKIPFAVFIAAGTLAFLGLEVAML